MSRSITSKLFRAARLSADARSVERGTEVKRATHIVEGRALGRVGFWRFLWGGGRR